MCTLFANLYVLLTWGSHMVYMGTPYIFDIYMIRCGWLGHNYTLSINAFNDIAKYSTVFIDPCSHKLKGWHFENNMFLNRINEYAVICINMPQLVSHLPPSCFKSKYHTNLLPENVIITKHFVIEEGTALRTLSCTVA